MRTHRRFTRRMHGAGFWASLIVVVLLVAYVQVILASQPHPTGRKIAFSAFENLANSGAIKSATVLDQDSYVEGVYHSHHGALIHFNTPYLAAGTNTRDELVQILTSNQIPFSIDQQRAKSLLPYLSLLLPSLILIVAIVYFIASYRSGSGLFTVRSGARLANDRERSLSFDDIAAQDKAVADLRELVEFLVRPARFERLGARVPNGVLLYGPPGCGKTLLARALAGESGAAFYSISGSDFVELFVGVGASRMRELFNQARDNAPAIVFIDEIDAVGRKRVAGPNASQGSSEEQAQALNQLLTEMDGFAGADGTIVIGATNRPEDLDAALLRPGRFDRTIPVDRPDEAGRAAILAVHARSKRLAAGVDLASIASRAIGLTGADLESLLNEAALLAARAGASEISQVELEEALARIMEAPERQRRLTLRNRTVGQQGLGTERVTFAQVAGADAALAELGEIKDFLRDPTRFERVGARFPRGFLLVGPSGCGKTLLARAVAGESNAAFLSVAASEFVEIVQGEGSGRVRDLFAQARSVAPTIVFIDEIDAIGARRGAAGSEQEQTLNQILIELDGFRPRDGVIVIAATNRDEILDEALVRAGRFDRIVTVDLPDQAGRRAILEVHAAGKQLASDVDLGAIAAITRGMTGADLANVMNEAALLTARRGRSEVSMAALENAVERAVIGIARSHVLTDEERHLCAVHEAGHVVVAHVLPEGRMPHMVSIIPSGQTLGQAWVKDSHDRLIQSRARMLDEMAILLGGCAAEELIFGQSSNSAETDLAEVGRIANRMVRELGMSAALGHVGYHSNGNTDGPTPSISDETARMIDSEVRRLTEDAFERANSILTTSTEALHRLVAALLEAERLGESEIARLLGARETEPVSRPVS